MLHPTLDGTVTAVVKSKYLEHHLLHFPVFFPIFDHKDMLSDCKGIQTQPPSSKTNIQPFSQTDQIIELYCEDLSVWSADCMLLSCRIRGELSESSLRIYPNVTELFAWNKRDI